MWLVINAKEYPHSPSKILDLCISELNRRSERELKREKEKKRSTQMEYM